MGSSHNSNGLTKNIITPIKYLAKFIKNEKKNMDDFRTIN